LNVKSQWVYTSRIFASILTMTVLAVMAMPAGVLAQDAPSTLRTAHHHYKLIDLGTLGGPISFFAYPGSLNINSHGTAIAEAETSIPDPNCLQPPTCLVNHGLKWQNGVATDMGALPGRNSTSFPFWVNDHGDVVGESTNGVFDPLTGYPELTAVLWEEGKILDLGTLGGNVSFASAINNRGLVVGGALNAIPDSDSTAFTSNLIPFAIATQIRAFLWQDGVMRDLGTLGNGNNAVALLVNDRGQVAGISTTNTSATSPTGNFTQHPFFWENGHMVDIGTLGGTSGIPNWMNSRGQVVGSSNVVGDQNDHPFFWDKKEGLKDLGLFPGGSHGHATWINDAGEIVGGSSCDSLDCFHAVLWNKGVMIDLGNLAGDCGSDATSINSQGQIVGYGSLPVDCGTEAHAILFENGGTPVDLNMLVVAGPSVSVKLPVNINDRGEIVAQGLLPNGNVHAVLLIPCDENHLGVAGCEYGPVDWATAAAVLPAAGAARAVTRESSALR
jgi:probable HAF family extracellular repeat protein